jgi:alpha-galactosidase
MAMLCHAMNRQTSIQLTGLCHSVQGTAGMIERWLKLKPGSMEYTCAGINHMAWYLSLEHRGRDLYPRLKKAMADKSVYDHEQVRNEMFLALGYYVTESSGHNSEYNWWFRKRPDLIKRYCRDGTGWNPGQYAYILKAYRNREGGGWQKSVRQWLNQDQVDLTRGHEYAASIINAYMGGDLYRFNGNVANNGLIDNLPTGACVEVPVLASSKGLEPVRVGSLPASVAMLTGLSAQIEMMAVDGSLKGDAELVYQAIAHDPLTAAKLSLAEIRKMVKEMFRKNEKWLPQFKKVNL